MLIDVSIAVEDYGMMKQRYSGEKLNVEDELKGLKVLKSNHNNLLERGVVGVLANHDKMYKRADLPGEKQILSSIFPEDLIFEGKKCRTPRINKVLRLILLIDNEKQNKKTDKSLYF